MDQLADQNQQQNIMNGDDEPMNRSIKQEVIDDDVEEGLLFNDNSPRHGCQPGGQSDGDDASASSNNFPPTVDTDEQHISDGNNGQDYEENEQSDSVVRENESSHPEPIDTVHSAHTYEPGLNVPRQSNAYVPLELVNEVLADQGSATLAGPPSAPTDNSIYGEGAGFLVGTYLNNPDIADYVFDNRPIVLAGRFEGNFTVDFEGNFEGLYNHMRFANFHSIYNGNVNEGFLRGSFEGTIRRVFNGETRFSGGFTGLLDGDFDGSLAKYTEAESRSATVRANRRRPIQLPTSVRSVAPSMNEQSVNDDEMMEHPITVHQNANPMPNGQLSDAQLPEPSIHFPDRNALSHQDNIQVNHLASSAESSAANDSGTNDDPVGPDTQQQQQQHQQQQRQRKLRKSSRINSRQKLPRAQSPPPIAAPAVEVKRSRISAPESLNHSILPIDRRDNSSTKSVIFVECPECEDQFDTFKELDEHMTSRHNQLRYPCLVAGCTEQFAKNAVAGHLKSKHPRATQFFCPVSDCRKEFTTQGAAGDHYRLHTKGEFKCKMCTCNKKMISLSTARQHLNTRSEGAWCGSQECGAIRFTLLSLKSHQNKHFGKKELRCCTFGQCTLCSFNTYTMLGHLRTEHRVKTSVRAQSLEQYTEILSESLLDRKLKALSKQRQSKVAMSSSSAASDRRVNNCGPSTSGKRSSRYVDESDVDDE